MNTIPESSPAEVAERAGSGALSSEREARAAVDLAVERLAAACRQSRPALQRLGGRARDALYEGYDSAREGVLGLRDRGVQAADLTRERVRDDPLKSLLAAAAVGAAVFAAAEYFRLRRRR